MIKSLIVSAMLSFGVASPSIPISTYQEENVFTNDNLNYLHQYVGLLPNYNVLSFSEMIDSYGDEVADFGLFFNLNSVGSPLEVLEGNLDLFFSSDCSPLDSSVDYYRDFIDYLDADFDIDSIKEDNDIPSDVPLTCVRGLSSFYPDEIIITISLYFGEYYSAEDALERSYNYSSTLNDFLLIPIVYYGYSNWDFAYVYEYGLMNFSFFDIDVNYVVSQNVDGIGESIVGAYTTGLTGLVEKIPNAIKQTFTNLFMSADGESLSTFSIVCLVFGGIALAFGITKLVYHLVANKIGA